MQGRVVVVEEGEEQEIEKGTLPSAVRSSERRQPRVMVLSAPHIIYG